VHVNTVRRWNDRGILKAYRIGPRGDRRFNKADIDMFLAGNGQPENETAAELVLVS
jgi:excisionase family DNA binding protein